jgi:hypothetical protein
MEIQGYAQISNNATSGIGAVDPKLFTDDEYCRVIEFVNDGAVLVIDREANGLMTFEKEDVVSSFRCSVAADVICPPDLNLMDLTLYMHKCHNRIGGYDYKLRAMIVIYSLRKGEFDDSILWSK